LIVEKLQLNSYRNIKKASLEFSERFNFITGRNAQGKTNLLEAIHIFSLGRSFRTRRSTELIRFGSEHFFLRLIGRSDTGVGFRLEMGLERSGRTRLSVNGKQMRGVSEIIGFMPSVVFSPSDVELSSGPPAGRRTYLDYTAAQVSPGFLADLKDYRQALKQRNSLLRAAVVGGTFDGAQLEVWDEAFARKGAAVVEGRIEILGVIAERAREIFSEVLGREDGLELGYRCSYDSGAGSEDTLRAALLAARESERRRGYTLAGPHYDDVAMRIGGEDVRRYASQGRRRLLAVVLKLAQADVIMARRGERPVVLLDDIFSELDPDVVSGVRNMLSDRYQSFITSPRRDDFPGDIPGAARYEVENGDFRGPGGSLRAS
jgi:DNA replication and repair protein RecF